MRAGDAGAQGGLTDQAFHGGSDCLQVFGGHGYVREWGIEQIVRDARVAMIYEGTNEIQAIDLLLRKTLPDGGQALERWLTELEAEVREGAQASGTLAHAVWQLAADLRACAKALGAAQADDAAAPYWVAGDFLRLTALTLMAWAGARIEAASAGSDTLRSPRWTRPLRALQQWVLPEAGWRSATIRTRCGEPATAGALPE